MEPLERLIRSLSRLPGIGSRSAERMALRIAADERALLDELIGALEEVRDKVGCCSRCGCVTPRGDDPCRLCVGPGRDDKTVCVVEDPEDIPLIEKSGGFRGRYHALMGRISAMKGKGPSNLRMRQLVDRVRKEKFREVILALSTDVEGDATAAFVTEVLKKHGVRVTRLAFGLPSGSGVRYADALTLDRAFKGRQEA